MELMDLFDNLQSDDDEIRRKTLQLLTVFPLSEVQELFFAAMGDPSWRVRKEAVECYLSSKPDIGSITALLTMLYNGDNAGLRNSAAEAISSYGVDAAPLLIELAKEPDIDVRKFAVDIMGIIGAPQFVPALVLMMGDPDENIASAAVEQLGVIGDVSVAEEIMLAILKRNQEFFRFNALVSLAMLSPQMVVPQLFLDIAGEGLLKNAVFDCLAMISSLTSQKELDLLIEGLSSRQRITRAAAIKALWKIDGRASSEVSATIAEAFAILKENEIIDGLVSLYSPEDIDLSSALIWSACKTMDRRFLPLLVDACKYEYMSGSAFAALKEFDCEALNFIKARYSSLDKQSKSALCMLIAKCGHDNCRDVLLSALEDPAWEVRRAALLAAGELDLISMTPTVIKLVDNEEPAVFSAAVDCLKSFSKFAPSELISHLPFFCSSSNPRHRIAASQLLASLGEWDRLVPLLKDPDSNVRKEASTSLGQSQIESHVSLLMLALADEDPEVRGSVASALGNFSDKRALKALEHAMNDEDVWVRSVVLNAIAAIDMERALVIIKAIITFADGLLLITAIKLLELVGTDEAVILIREHALNNTDRDVVRQAEKSLELLTSASFCTATPAIPR